MVLRLIKKRKPDTIEQLMRLVKEEERVSDEAVLSVIQELEDEKKIESTEFLFPIMAKDYLFSLDASWFWVVIASASLAVFFTFFSSSFYPFEFFQNVLGLILVCFLPGFVLVKTAYPISAPFKIGSMNIERIALSVGFSLVISSFSGLVFYYFSWKLDNILFTFYLFVFTVIMGSAAFWREYQARRMRFIRRPRKTAGYFKA